MHECENRKLKFAIHSFIIIYNISYDKTTFTCTIHIPVSSSATVRPDESVHTQQPQGEIVAANSASDAEQDQ